MAKLTTKMACELARNLENVTEKDHFGGDAFYHNKKIFATVWHNKNEVNLKLTSAQQKTFLEKDGESFVEINNAWGKQGWTTVQMAYVEKKEFCDALETAWANLRVTKNQKTGSRFKSKTRRGQS